MSKLAAKLRELGLRGFVQRGIARLGHAIFRVLVLRPAAAILRLLRVRFLPVNHLDRIGHLAIEPDCYIKEGLLRQRPSYWTLLVVPPGQKVANARLLRYWSAHLTIVRSSFLARCLMPFVSLPALRYETYGYTVAIDQTARYVSIQNSWHGRPPLLRLTDRDRSRGWANLEKLGLSRGSWFVGVHCRESGYAPDKIHDFRDADIGNYIPAIQAIVECGGWCIRLGDPTMKPLPAMERVIDYAHSSLRSDWMDVFLCASARFILANTSGLYVVGSIFGVPAACPNIAPMSALSYGPDDLDIPKLLYSKPKRRHLTFPEVFDSPVANFRFSHLYEAAGIRVEQSTSEDIGDLALEMLARLDGRLDYSQEDEAHQKRFKALLRPGHYSYGAKTRIGRAFLRKYAALLDG